MIETEVIQDGDYKCVSIHNEHSTNNTAVLIDVDYEDAKQTCERIEGEYIEDFDNHHDIQEVPPNMYEVYKLTDFMDLCNDQEINLENYFITFVTT